MNGATSGEEAVNIVVDDIRRYVKKHKNRFGDYEGGKSFQSCVTKSHNQTNLGRVMRRPNKRILGNLKNLTMAEYLEKHRLVGLTPLVANLFTTYGYG